jgi:hypothetical protein
MAVAFISKMRLIFRTPHRGQWTPRGDKPLQEASVTRNGHSIPMRHPFCLSDGQAKICPESARDWSCGDDVGMEVMVRETTPWGTANDRHEGWER